jgi:hypothetical protein
MTATENRISTTVGLAACAATMLLASACWQVSGIDVIDLPVRDGDLDADDLEAESDDVDAADDGGPTDSVDAADPAADDVPSLDPEVEDSIPTMDLTLLCQAYAQVRCDYMDRCCTDQDYAYFDWFLTNYDCNDPDGSADYHACMEGYGPSVDEGKILLASSGFARCQSALTSLLDGECPGWGRFERYLAMAIELDCVDLFVGTAAAGEACRFRAECAGSSCCVDGRCTACMSPDGGCEGNESCPVGQRCIRDACTSPAGANEACDLQDEMGVSDCAPDFWCGGETCEQLQDSNSYCMGDGMELKSCAGICIEEGVCQDLCGY